MNALDILNLPGFKVLKTEENQYDYRISAELTEKPTFCPYCESKPNLYLHGSREQLVRDTNIHGKRVGILYLRKRYKCRECGSTFFEPTSVIDKKARFTTRLFEYIQQQALSRPFLQISEEIGISHTIVRKIFNEFAEKKAKETQLPGADRYRTDKPRGTLL